MCTFFFPVRIFEEKLYLILFDINERKEGKIEEEGQE